MGAGRTELLESLFGAPEGVLTGRIELDGQPIRFAHPEEAVGSGVALVTEDRKRLGLFANFHVAANMTLVGLPEVAAAGFFSPRAERERASEAAQRLRVKAPALTAPINALSGGNQQKAILARWLMRRPRVLLLDDPTRGVDVGAKGEIYDLISQLAADGVAVLMTSSELPELLAVCHRILVLCEGRLTAEFPREEATEAGIMAAATGLLESKNLPLSTD